MVPFASCHIAGVAVVIARRARRSGPAEAVATDGPWAYGSSYRKGGQ